MPHEQDHVLDDDAGSVERIDLTNLEEPTTHFDDSYDMDTQDDLFSSISGTVTADVEIMGDGPSKFTSVDPTSINITESRSPADFGVLLDTPPDAGSGSMARQLDMTEVLSFLAYDKGEDSIPGFVGLGEMDAGDITEIPADHAEVEVIEVDEDDKGYLGHATEEIIIEEDPNIQPEEHPSSPAVSLSNLLPSMSFMYFGQMMHDQPLAATINSEEASAIPPSMDHASDTTRVATPPIIIANEGIIRPAEPHPPNDDPTTSTVPLMPDLSLSVNSPHSTREIRNGIPMPVSANPNVPDPTDRPTSVNYVAPIPVRTPIVLSLPGTPAIVLSPVGTPGRPTPVSMPVPGSVLGSAVLRAVQLLQSQSANSASGLFTPATGNGSESVSDTPSNQQSRADTPDVVVDVSRTVVAQDAISVPATSEGSLDDRVTATPREGSPDIDEAASNGGEMMDLDDRAVDQTRTEPSSPEEAPTGHDEVMATPPRPLPEDRGTSTSRGKLHSNNRPTPIQSALSVVYRSEPTTPILHADPYPYSLSTPGASLHVFEDGSQDEDADSPSEEENDRSSSSFTAKNEADAEESDQVMTADADGSEFDLLYPSEDAEGEGDVFTVHEKEVGGKDVSPSDGADQPAVDENLGITIPSQDESIDVDDPVQIPTHQVTNGSELMIVSEDEEMKRVESADHVPR